MPVKISLMLILASFCLAEQENQRKNIKMLFVPADVMATLRKNLTVKDLPPGLPGQSTQRWSPVHLPGDKTHSFEIRINPRTAHKLNMNFQHFRIGHGHGLLLELKNVSLSTKGKTVLDRLVEFYKNCGGSSGIKRPRLGMMHRIRRPLPSMQHSLLLPGDIPLLKRIQNALERFFPKRHDGSVDVFQHKDSNGAVHFLPFEEVRREVNNLIKRTTEKRDCVKISTNALTRALEAFRRQMSGGNDNTTTANNNPSNDASDEGVDANSDAHADNGIKNNDNSNNNNNNSSINDNKNNNNDDNKNSNNNGDNNNKSNKEQDDEEGDVFSFSRDLKSLNLPPANKGNLTSSVINVPSDAAATKLVSALADLRKEINHLTSDFKRKEDQAIPNSDKEIDEMSNEGSKHGNKALVYNTFKNISNDNSESKDEKSNQLETGFDLSEVTNRRKMMSSDESDEKDSKTNKDDDNNSSSGSNSDRESAKALKIKNVEQDLSSGKAELGKDSLKIKKNASKSAYGSSQSSVAVSGRQERNNAKVAHARPVNQTVNLLQSKPLKDAKGFKASKNRFAHTGHSKETKINKEGRRYRARNKDKHHHKDQVKDEKGTKRPAIVFHYKQKVHNKDGEYGKVKDIDEDDDDDVDSERYGGEGRFAKLVHLHRRKPRIKEMMLQDEQEKLDTQDNYRQRKFDDSPVDASYNSEENNFMKARLLGKLRNHGHASSIRRRKSPKIRVVVYDDEEKENEPHNDSWRNSETEEFAEKIHEDDNEAETEPSETTTHRSEPVYMDSEKTQQNEQGESSNSRSESDSDSDMQYLSDSIGADDSNRLGGSDKEGEVPDLEPYLKKHYEDEEDAESEEIKMYNDQDDKLGDTMEKRISKTAEQDDMMLDEKTNNLDDNDDEEPGRIHIHKLPFKIQEDSDGVVTSPPREQPHDALGLQQVLSPPAMPSMASQPVAMTSTTSTTSQTGMDLSPNIVMPPEQSMLIPGAAELPQMTAGGAQIERPNIAAFLGVNYQPSETTQMTSMMPQTPFPQVSSMMPVQPGAPDVSSPVTPVMQPGQIRALISGAAKAEPKSGVRKTVVLTVKLHKHSGIGNGRDPEFSGDLPKIHK